jgi:hypothetical protein
VPIGTYATSANFHQPRDTTQLEGLVHWRGGVAERYPEDDRNAEAVMHAKRMLEQLPQANELLLARLQDIDRRLAERFPASDVAEEEYRHREEESEFWRTVGFHSGYVTIDQLIEDVIQLP